MGLPSCLPQQAGRGLPSYLGRGGAAGLSPSTDAVGRRVGGGAGLVGGHVGCGQVTGKARHSAACSLSACIPAMSVLWFLKEPTLGIQKRVFHLLCLRKELRGDFEKNQISGTSASSSYMQEPVCPLWVGKPLRTQEPPPAGYVRALGSPVGVARLGS